MREEESERGIYKSNKLKFIEEETKINNQISDTEHSINKYQGTSNGEKKTRSDQSSKKSKIIKKKKDEKDKTKSDIARLKKKKAQRSSIVRIILISLTKF